MKLKDQHIFVTGGADGIGAAIVLDVAQEGAKVSFCDINVEKAEAYAKDLTAKGFSVFFNHLGCSDLFKKAVIVFFNHLFKK